MHAILRFDLPPADDVACYSIIGVALAMVLYLIARTGGWKRGLRRRRGACLHCGYDLRGELDAGCPECGWRRDSHNTQQ